MDIQEINAGRVYLRGFSATDRIDDRPVLPELFPGRDLHAVIRDIEHGWADSMRLTWMVCEQTDVVPIGMAILDRHGTDSVVRLQARNSLNQLLPGDPAAAPRTAGEALRIAGHAIDMWTRMMFPSDHVIVTEPTLPLSAGFRL